MKNINGPCTWVHLLTAVILVYPHIDKAKVIPDQSDCSTALSLFQDDGPGPSTQQSSQREGGAKRRHLQLPPDIEQRKVVVTS